MTRPDWGRIREQLWNRCDGLDEITGQPLDFDTFDAHHRRPKGMGGTRRMDRDWLTNLLALDPRTHNGGPLSVHGRPDWSRERGYLIAKDVWMAGAVPFLHHGTGWLWLDRTGGYYDSSGRPIK